jgi:hypothetical protein
LKDLMFPNHDPMHQQLSSILHHHSLRLPLSIASIFILTSYYLF